MKNMIPEIPGMEIPAKKSSTKEILKALSVLLFVGASIAFAFKGMYSVINAVFTPYKLQTIDIAYLTSGVCLLAAFAVFIILGEIKSQNETIMRGLTHLLRKQNNSIPSAGASNISNMLSNMFGPKNSTGNPADFTGSISVVDMNNPNNPIFKGDFANFDEMQKLRDKLINKMLNTQDEVDGKKMTKQEILNSMTVEQLEKERLKAEREEDWLWAAAVRDKIAEKKGDSNL